MEHRERGFYQNDATFVMITTSPAMSQPDATNKEMCRIIGRTLADIGDTIEKKYRNLLYQIVIEWIQL
eukprot:Seg3280.3 transcript_id=Seg3280.3/GoldUCD/mRNA.D3Y31 product="hypothetical protein" protein_id=Seg3280.3/GoldUCD/D3Y31